MKMPSIWAILVLLVVVMVLFGARRLPDIAGSVGKSLKIFKKEIKELTDDDDEPQSGRTTPMHAAAEHTTATTPARSVPLEREPDPGSR